MVRYVIIPFLRLEEEIMNEDILLESMIPDENMDAEPLEETLQDSAQESEEEIVQASDEEQQPLQETPAEQPEKADWRKQLFRDARDIFYMLALFMLVYILCFRTVVVVGNSMHDTLMNGDRLLLVSNLLYRQPKQGDVIVASKDSFRDGECIIKRVIATEGQQVDIDFKNGIVYVDGEAIPEPYLYSQTLNHEGMEFPVVVPEGCLFVMGDNRLDSMDSRSQAIGFIDEREVLGKAILIMIPGINEETGERDFGRMGGIE